MRWICCGYQHAHEARRSRPSGRCSSLFPWQFGVDFEAIGRGGPLDIFDAQLDVRELLRSQDKTEWVVISTGMFMSYLFNPSSAWSMWRTARFTSWAASTTR